jgi:hypothetical protein
LLSSLLQSPALIAGCLDGFDQARALLAGAAPLLPPAAEQAAGLP